MLVCLHDFTWITLQQVLGAMGYTELGRKSEEHLQMRANADSTYGYVFWYSVPDMRKYSPGHVNILGTSWQWVRKFTSTGCDGGSSFPLPCPPAPIKVDIHLRLCLDGSITLSVTLHILWFRGVGEPHSTRVSFDTKKRPGQSVAVLCNAVAACPSIHLSIWPQIISLLFLTSRLSDCVCFPTEQKAQQCWTTHVCLTAQRLLRGPSRRTSRNLHSPSNGAAPTFYSRPGQPIVWLY
jgi:hypothetical protein